MNCIKIVCIRNCVHVSEQCLCDRTKNIGKCIEFASVDVVAVLCLTFIDPLQRISYPDLFSSNNFFAFCIS